MNNKFIDANRIPYSPTKFLSFNDVEIVPQFSNLDGPDDKQISLSTRLGRYFLLESPIVRFGNVNDCIDISKYGGLCILVTNLYTNIPDFINDILELNTLGIKIAFTIGIHPNDEQIVQTLLDKGIKAPLVVIDSLRAESQSCVEQVRRLDLKYKNMIDIGVNFLQTPIGIMKAITAGATVVFVKSKFGATATIEARRVLYGLQSNCTLIAHIDQYIHNGKAMVCGADAVCSLPENSLSVDNIRETYYKCNVKNSDEAFERGLLIENTTFIR